MHVETNRRAQFVPILIPVVFVYNLRLYHVKIILVYIVYIVK